MFVGLFRLAVCFLSECFVLIYLAERVYFSPGWRPVTVSVCFCGVATLDFETKQGKIKRLQNVISRVGIRCSPPLPLPLSCLLGLVHHHLSEF